MKNLYLMRHGEAGWGNPSDGDFARPLEARGERAAQLMGRHMASSNMDIDLILCSAATRARQTLTHFLEGYAGNLENRIEETLYLAPPQTIINHLRAVPDMINSVLIIGHNPGFQSLSLFLASENSGEDRRRIQYQFATGGLAAFTYDRASWRSIEGDAFSLTGYYTPNSLQAEAL